MFCILFGYCCKDLESVVKGCSIAPMKQQHTTTMRKLNYTRLMALNPFKYGEMINSIGQLIEFYEHPTRGDEYPVIAVCHYHALAAATDFYELDDMIAEHGECEPVFVNGDLYHGGFKA
jgi:hypothetical protein